MTTFDDEIESAICTIRQQHEIECNRADQVDQHLEARSNALIARIRGIRERESYRRADIARELLLLASEIGMLPPASPEPIAVGSHPTMRMPNCIARHASDDLARSVN